MRAIQMMCFFGDLGLTLKDIGENLFLSRDQSRDIIIFLLNPKFNRQKAHNLYCVYCYN